MIIIKEDAIVTTTNQDSHYNLNLILLGPPGSGKGTQAQHLCQQFEIKHISTGDLFRENIKNGTPLGQLAKAYMDRGELVPDDITANMVRERLSRPDIQRGFLLDGFPRTLTQAEALSRLLADLGQRLHGVLHFTVSDEEIVARLAGRLLCRECQVPFHRVFQPFTVCPYNKCQGEYLYQREDDKEETIRARLEVYHHQTAPLINYYAQAGLLCNVDGEGDLATVTHRVLAAACNLLGSTGRN